MKMKKLIPLVTICLCALFVNGATYANYAKSQAMLFMTYYIEKANSPLSQVAILIKIWRAQYGNCRANDGFKLKLPEDSVFSQVTNDQCVAVATFKTTNVPKPLAGKTIAIGPSYNSTTKNWSFEDLLIATNIIGLPNAEYKPADGSSSAILGMTTSFVGGLYASQPVKYLSRTTNTPPPPNV